MKIRSPFGSYYLQTDKKNAEVNICSSLNISSKIRRDTYAQNEITGSPHLNQRR
jgi:hypothetical protein